MSDKIQNPSDLCKIEEGIWYVGKIPNGGHASYLATKLEELPQAITKASLVRAKNKIALNLEIKMKQRDDRGLEITLKDILRILFDSVG